MAAILVQSRPVKIIMRNVIALCILLIPAANAATPAPEFYKDVLPILQERCQVCHRPGEAAPMSFLTYKEVRPWAKAIRETVVLRKMPPWLADPHFGKFSNDQSLSAGEMETLSRWADAGAQEGDPRKAPPPRQFVSGWSIGKPDAVLGMGFDYEVPATGAIEYQHFVVPTNFKQDTWVEVAEVRPGDRSAVHHAAVFVRPPESKWLRDLEPGKPYGTKNQSWFMGRTMRDELLTFQVPGGVPSVLRPGQAKLIPAGSDLVFQIHYTANGKIRHDQTRIGLIFAKQPPAERVHSLTITNVKLVIPPENPAFPFQATYTLPEDLKLVSLNPHMHVRGKSFQFRATYPTGESEILLSVPNYSFFWQMYYYLTEQKVLPKGTRIDCLATYDNSAGNPNNPDPKAEVHWGDQSWDEMLVGTMDVAIPTGMDLMKLYPAAK